MEEAKDFLDQFEQILQQDSLIDEVGILHPSQFRTLEGEQIDQLNSDAVEFGKRYFWCKDHKLAISSEVLSRLYRAALLAHSNARTIYTEHKDCSDQVVIDLMRHSKALLILIPDFLSGWNSRKMVLSRNYNLQQLMDELQLSTLILSYSPKSENAWCHRRWVIKKVAEKLQDLTEILEKESVLVKKIAEKSKMNYRAWRHRCWLIPYMTREQVLDELKKSTKWNELHVADNSCFHFRRSLLLTVLDDSFGTEDGEDSSNRISETRILFKEELKWNELLVRRYKGREALWVHRRFLSLCWIKHFLIDDEIRTSTENSPQTTSLLDLFLAQELYLLSDCINAPADEFEDTHVQAEHAALYILLISKQVPEVEPKLGERLHSTGSLKDILAKACPQKSALWMSLLNLSSET